MGNLERKQELILEIIKLIKEFRKEECSVGREDIEYIKFDNEKQVLIIKNLAEDTEEFRLDELSDIFSYEIEDGMLYEQVGIILSDANIKELSKEEFIEVVGSSLYAKDRCTEIHERLKQIEKEFCELSQ